MMLKTRGIVLRSLKYGETSVIADIFTEEKGLHTFIGGSVRTAKASMSYGLFQPMSVVEMVAYFREDEGALNRLKELRAAELYSNIPFDIRRGAVVLFMAELCRKCIHLGEENPELFDFLLEQLRWLDSTPHPIANQHLHFMVNLSGHLGFQPEITEADGYFFDLKEGLFLQAPPVHTQYLKPELAQHLLDLLNTPLENCHEIAMDRPTRKILLHQLLDFFKLHMPGFTGVNTPDILEMIM